MKTILLSVLAAIIASIITVQIIMPKGGEGSVHQESAYERVMRTGTIRCGYGLWGNYVKVDPNTREFSGVLVDYMEQMAANLGLKVDWAEEIGWGDAIAALKNKRFDVFCGGMGFNAERGRYVDYVTPIFALRSDFFVRVGDTRFDKDIRTINNPNITMITLEGDIYEKVVNRDFPDAKKMQLPQIAPFSDLYENVKTGKADVFFGDSGTGEDYMRQNPGILRKVSLPKSYIDMPASVTVSHGEMTLKRMLDIATQEMVNNGQIDDIISKYDHPDSKDIRVYDFNYRTESN